MSVINKMLQDLDHRNAAAVGDGDLGPQAVKPVNATRGGHEWFWRVLAVLVLISVAWVGWVAYQLQPRSVVTPMTLRLAELQKAEQARALEQARTEMEPKPAPVEPKPAPVVEAPKAEPVAEAPKPAPVVEPKNEKPAETFKLARSIETPIPEPRTAKAAAVKPPAAPKPQATKLEPLQTKVVVDKVERNPTKSVPVNDRAEAHFRRAAQLLGQGRVSEAESELGGALKADPSHARARATGPLSARRRAPTPPR